jgi:hypothetical protein
MKHFRTDIYFEFTKGLIKYKLGIKFFHITEIIQKSYLIKIRLWFCSIWVCRKIISSNVRYHTSPGFSHLTCRKSICGSWGSIAPSSSKKLYATRISSNSKNPAQNIIFKPSFTEKFVNKPNEIKPLGLRLKDDLDKINPDSILQNDDEDVPP